MIKMTYAYVQRNQEFGMAMRKLLGTPGEQKLCYAIKKINDKLQSQRGKIVEEYNDEVLKVFAEMDEKGVVKPNPENPAQFQKKEGITEEQLDEAQEKFWNKEFTVDRQKLKLSALAHIPLTAMELTALEPLYEDDSGEGEEA
jgi:hypothetical protein